MFNTDIELHLVESSPTDDVAMVFTEEGDTVHADVYCTTASRARARDAIVAFIASSKGVRLAA